MIRGGCPICGVRRLEQDSKVPEAGGSREKEWCKTALMSYTRLPSRYQITL